MSKGKTTTHFILRFFLLYLYICLFRPIHNIQLPFQFSKLEPRQKAVQLCITKFGSSTLDIIKMSESEWDEEPVSPKKLHWGEIPSNRENIYIPDVSEIIKKSMDQDCLNDYHDDENVLRFSDLTIPCTDPLITYAIQLHKWISDVTDMIRVAELAVERNVIPSADAKPPIPEMPEIHLKPLKKVSRFMKAGISKSFNQDDFEIPELSTAIVQKILTKCVATMTAHIGFETTHQSVLDILVDVLEQFFIKICDRFTAALQEEELLDTGGFSNVLERVLVEFGLGGFKGLSDYYQCRVVKYITVLQKRCKELDEHYSTLLLPKDNSPQGDTNKHFKVRVKEEKDINNDTEMHTVDGGILSAGFELLDSLEAANMQGLSNTGDDFHN